jgi:hypothetical protein
VSGSADGVVRWFDLGNGNEIMHGWTLEKDGATDNDCADHDSRHHHTARLDLGGTLENDRDPDKRKVSLDNVAPADTSTL